MASSSEASCISDPNFAVICAFLERFSKSCGITYPTFMELQEMLENVEQVPQELIDLHIKLLRKARKTVFIEKWERALIKFCHTYSSQDGWEIERFGYKKSRLEVKLRVLKMLLEGQFDLNNKFKASINTLESDELRSKPLGKDKLGRIYWLQSDPTSNIRVYREDLDDESWTLVAKDRSSMVDLLQELSGEEFPLDLNLINEDSTSLDVDKPVTDTGQPVKDEEDSSVQSSKENKDPIPNGENVTTECQNNLDKVGEELNGKEPTVNGVEELDIKSKQEVEVDENVCEEKEEKPTKEDVIVGEAIEEPVMYVVGEGSGEDCNTGNPEKEEKSEDECRGNLGTSEQVEVKESVQNSSETDPPNPPTEKLKPAPKLWSIDTICGVNSSSEINDGEKQEVVDIKVKHKNFSSFSIDSVLEKRDSSNSVSVGSVSKFPLSDCLSDRLHDTETKTSLGESNSVILEVPNNESAVKLLDDNPSEVNSKTEISLGTVEKSTVDNEQKETVSCETVDEDHKINVSESLLDVQVEEKKDSKQHCDNNIVVTNEIKETPLNEPVIGQKDPSVKEPCQIPISVEGQDTNRGLEDVKEMDLNLQDEVSREVLKTPGMEISSEKSVEIKESRNRENGKEEPVNKSEEKETLTIDSKVVNKVETINDESELVAKSSEGATENLSLPEVTGEKNFDEAVKAVTVSTNPKLNDPQKGEETDKKVEDINSAEGKETEKVSEMEKIPEKTEGVIVSQKEAVEDITADTNDEGRGETKKEIMDDSKPEDSEEGQKRKEATDDVRAKEISEDSGNGEKTVEAEAEVLGNLNKEEKSEKEALEDINMEQTSEKNLTVKETFEEKESVGDVAGKEVLATEENVETSADPNEAVVQDEKNEEVDMKTEEKDKEAREGVESEAVNVSNIIPEGGTLKENCMEVDETEGKRDTQDRGKEESEANKANVTVDVPPAEEKRSVKDIEGLVKDSVETEGKTDVIAEGNHANSESEKVAEPHESEVKKTKNEKQKTNEDKEPEQEIPEPEAAAKTEKENEEDTKNVSKTKKEDAKKVSEGRTGKKGKKEVPPQRVLSRNRKTIEENVTSEKAEKPKGERKRKEKLSVNDVEETVPEVEKVKEGKNLPGKARKDEEVKEKEEKNLPGKTKKAEEVQGKEGKNLPGKARKEEEVQGKEVEEESTSVTQEEEDEEAGEEEEREGDKEEMAKTKRQRGRRKRRRWWKRKIPKESAVGGEKMIISKESSSKQPEEKEEKTKKKGRPKKEESASRTGSHQIPSREIKLLGITEETESELPSIRQSRRIAQIKLKEEAERRRLEALQLESFKEKKNKKGSKTGKRKSKQSADSDSYDEKNDDDEEDSDEDKGGKKEKSRKRKKKKDKLKFNELNPWISSSGSSTADEEEEDIDEDPHEDEELVFKSDHEFSPESDVEDPDYKPIKRARTAKVEESKDEAGKYDDTSCEKCGNNDHPEWILLCDKCDKGWHASCVRPALMVVPEGDWFCPPCEHLALIMKLQESLAHYDRCQKQRENEELRKKRLAFVGISLDNVLPPAKSKSSKHENGEGDKEEEEDASCSGSGSDSESESGSGSSSDDSSEPVYQLRERRSNVTSYRYNEYDELIKSALQDEMEAVKGAGNAGRGKDINNIVNAEKQSKEREERPQEETEKVFQGGERIGTEGEEEKTDGEKIKNEDIDYEVDTEGDEDEEDENVVDEIPPVVPKSGGKKKSKSVKITSLDFTSEEEDRKSDSDFKGSGSEEESDYSLPSESESSDDIGRKRKGDGPLRRSTRARISRYDRDFINDDSEDDEPRRKKNRRSWDSSESSESDRSWGRRKRKPNKSLSSRYPRNVSKSKKKKKQKKRPLDSDDEGDILPKRPKHRKIKYGGLESPDEEKVLSRRTRGKKINYQEMNGSDTDEDGRPQKSKSSRIIESDEDFLAENEKEMQDGESEEVESGAEEEEEEENGNEKRNENNKKVVEKMKKKKWVIPDPDDFSENDLMEDKQLDEFAEELEDLDEDDEEILGKILESGDVPIEELRAAVKRAKQNKSKEGEKEVPEANVMPRTFPPIPAHMEYPGGGKFPKIGKMKITPSRAELASQLGGKPPLGVPMNFMQNAGRFPPPEKALERQDLSQVKDKEGEPVNPGSSFLLRTLQSEPKAGSVGDANIPSNHSAKDEGSRLCQEPFPSTPGEAPPGPLNMMAMMNSMTQSGAGSNSGNPGMPMSVGSDRPVPPFGSFQGILPPTTGLPAYPATIPTTVTGFANLDPQAQARRKLASKVGLKVKRKMDEMSPRMDESSESGDLCPPLEQGEEFAHMKGVQDSSAKKKGRGRGKKQLLAEAQAQVQAQGKPDMPIGTVQTPTQFPPPGLPSEGGSVITRMLNTPQTFPGKEVNQFPPGQRNPSSFRPPLFGNPPRPPAPVRLRVPGPGGILFHTPHRLDPSPSGGGAITIPCTSGGLTKASPPSPPFTRAPGGPVLPRFGADPTVRHLFPSPNSPPRPEFSSFPNYYGNFPPPAASIPGGEEPAFQNSSFPEHFGEGQAPPGPGSKPFEDETGGEFGGLASYFASQREDDLDT